MPVEKLAYWCKLYRSLKNESICLDIETRGVNKEITVIGLYQPSEGIPEMTRLVRGFTLSGEELQKALAGCKLLITYNGLKHDIPRIRKEFPGCIPQEMPVLDLYLFAWFLGMPTSLKVLEQTLNVDRPEELKGKVAVTSWKKFEEKDDKKALQKLFDYNEQDSINLYPIAEILVEMAEKELVKGKVVSVGMR